jgi:putative ABC transport system ATP-binding protein
LISTTGQNILALMKEINAKQKTTFVFSTHDAMIHQMADHVILLKDGKIEKEYKRESGAKS